MLIIHGNNVVSSRQEYFLLKKKYTDRNISFLEINGSDLTLQILSQKIGTISLLSKENPIFIQEFFIRPVGAEKKSIIKYLYSHTQDMIYIWEPRDVSEKIKDFSQKIIRKFDLPKTVFKYLDNLDLSTLKAALLTTPPEHIFYLLVNFFHQLLLFKTGYSLFPFWQSSRLNILANKYSLEKLQYKYLQLLSIDYQEKKSASVFNLSASLELWQSTF